VPHARPVGAHHGTARRRSGQPAGSAEPCAQRQAQARAGRPACARHGLPKPGKPTAGEALDNFFQVRSCAVPRVRLPPGMPAAA